MLKKILLVLLSTSIGSGVTYVVLKDKYERELQAEREKMIKEISDFKEKAENKNKEESKEELIENIDKKLDKVDELISEYAPKEEKEEHKEDEPYIITAEEFDSKGYELRYWYVYNDGVVVDENNDVLTKTECDNSVGSCINNIFDEEILHIRNDNTEEDYEIKAIDEDYLGDEDEEL